MIQIDMPMPDNCVECRFNASGFGYCNAMPVNFCGRVNDLEEDGRPEWCPLKAQEPMVMTIDGLRKLQKQDVVWLEDADKEAIIPGIVITVLKKEWQFMTFTGCSGLFCVSCVDYGKRWRCWTSRPDQATREAIPWN